MNSRVTLRHWASQPWLPFFGLARSAGTVVFPLVLIVNPSLYIYDYDHGTVVAVCLSARNTLLLQFATCLPYSLPARP